MVRDSGSESAREEHDRLMGNDVNPRMRARPRRPLPPAVSIQRDDDFFSPDDRELKDLRERLSALRLGRFMSVGIPWEGAERLVLVLHRDCADRRDFDAEEQGVALQLIPHLRQAVQNQFRFEAARDRADAVERTVDQLRCAVVLVTPGGDVRWANRAAQGIMARQDRLWVQGDQLRTTRAEETMTLRRLIARAAAGVQHSSESPEQFLVLGGRGNGELLQIMIHAVQVDRPRSSAENTGPLVLLILSEPCATPELPADALAELFGLSRTEAGLAAALYRGISLNEYAERRGVTVGTARFQLKQVLAKTGAHRQGNLIQQLCSSVIAQCARGGGGASALKS
jgi:DNA-binding CsgD family transcriptional regulator